MDLEWNMGGINLVVLNCYGKIDKICISISSTQESDREAGAEVISQGIQWTSFDGTGDGKISGI